MKQLKSLKDDDDDGGGQARPVNTVKELEAAVLAMSAAAVIPATWDLPYGSNPHGVYGATPPEMLHQYDLGLLRTTWECKLQIAYHKYLTSNK